MILCRLIQTEILVFAEEWHCISTTKTLSETLMWVLWRMSRKNSGPMRAQGITRRDLEAALAASWASQRVMFLKPDGNLPF